MSSEHGHTWTDKKKLMLRARRMDGQADGIARMIEEDRSCEDILQQIVALISASEELAVLLIQDHVLVRCHDGEAERLSEELSSYLRRVIRR